MKKILSAMLCAAVLLTTACNAAQQSETTTETAETTETSETTVETTVTETTAETTTETTPPEVLACAIELSGKTEDKLEITKNSFYETDRYVIYFEKDAVIYGDIASRIDAVMDELEKNFDLSYDYEGYEAPSEWKTLYGYSDLVDVNKDASKMDIVVRHDRNDGVIDQCDSNAIYLFDSDFDPARENYGILYHEFTHLLRLRQSPDLGKVLEEGIATYTQSKITRAHNEPDWDTIQFITDKTFVSPFDGSYIEKDAMKAFCDANTGDRSSEQREYQIGIRFVAFLVEKYGDGIIKTLSDNARKYQYSQDDNDAIIKIIKESTSDDVFKQFEKWLPKGWKAYSQSYLKYMKNKGLL